MIISVGSDHAGYSLKMSMIPYLQSLGYTVLDHGNRSPEELVYFPEVAKVVCEPVLAGTAERGIMFCGTGVGASIACNKIPGIRASIVHDYQSAHQCVEHDHVNVMCIGEKIVGEWLAMDLLKAFLEAKGNTDDRTVQVLRLLEEMDEGN
jgi:ribose 5-phosphate isomerase B